MPLRTDYTNDILDTSKNTERKYNIKNSNGTIVEENVTFEDVTDYTQEGSRFGASDINATNTKVNELDSEKVSGFSDETYQAVTGLAYDSTNKKLGLKVGADTIIPFSGEKPIGVIQRYKVSGYPTGSTYCMSDNTALTDLISYSEGGNSQVTITAKKKIKYTISVGGVGNKKNLSLLSSGVLNVGETATNGNRGDNTSVIVTIQEA